MLRLPQHIDLLPNGYIIPCTEDTCTNLLLSLKMSMEGGNIHFDYYNADNDEYLSGLITDKKDTFYTQKVDFANIISKVMKSDFKTPISYMSKSFVPANSEIF